MCSPKHHKPNMNGFPRLFRFLVVVAAAVLPTACAFNAAKGPVGVSSPSPAELYKAGNGLQTRWAGFENPKAVKGGGGKANAGAKGHAAESLKAGESKTLLDVQGCGIVRRIWMTLHPRGPQMMRALRLDMYWDGADAPAVSAPLGDFFGHVFGRMAPLDSELFASPEGRSLNCVIPMPFRTAAKIVLTNDSDEDVLYLFYEVDFVLQDTPQDKDTLYFHAYWRRERYTTLGEDFEILPAVHGKGRYLGANVGVILHPDYTGWWGEGEVKIYLDGDRDYPTLNNSGTEDYVGTAWGQGVFQSRCQGAILADGELGHYAFYRYHIPDPVYFDKDCRVTIQQMGNDTKEAVLRMVDKGIPITPVLVDHGGAEKFLPLLDGRHSPDLKQDPEPGGYVCYLRRDDVSAVAYFYLDSPVNGLPGIAPLKERIEAIPEKNPPRSN